jgi:predicted DNA binding CopG/RHH family protein
MKTYKTVAEFWKEFAEGRDPLDGDLSEIITKFDWKPARLTLRKDKTVTLRMPGTLVDSIKAEAKKEGVGYQGLMRDLITEGLDRRQHRALVAGETMDISYPKAKKKRKA